MSRQRYEFSVREGFHIKKDAAARVGQLIVELADRGIYSPQALVDKARDPRCPAHRDFEWNDRSAAEKHRLNQALFYQRGIQYSIVVRGNTGKQKPIQMRVAYPVTIDGKAGYASGGQIVEDRDLLRTIQDRALAALESWKKQYEMLRRVGRFVGIFVAIDTAIKQARQPKDRKAARVASPRKRARSRAQKARSRLRSTRVSL